MAEPPAPAAAVLEGYGAGGFRVGGAVFRECVLLLPSGARGLKAPSLVTLDVAELAPLVAEAAELDLLLVGCGARAQPAPQALRAACREAGLALELLDTGAACRTFGLLQAEGRRVAALLFPV